MRLPFSRPVCEAPVRRNERKQSLQIDFEAPFNMDLESMLRYLKNKKRKVVQLDQGKLIIDIQKAGLT
jgi:hypothetical protein